MYPPFYLVKRLIHKMALHFIRRPTHSKSGSLELIHQKIASRRTIRKFSPKAVPKEVLLQCVDAARLSPSAANRQPLKYVIVNDHSLLRDAFKTLSWAGYLPKYQPSEAEMPQAYIVILLDKNLRKEAGHDAGIAAMSISMVAYDNGLGSCILGAIDRGKLRTALNLPESLDIILVVAIGYPAEAPVLDEVTDTKPNIGWTQREFSTSPREPSKT